MQQGRRAFAAWNATLDGLQRPTNDPVPTYAQVIGVVNAKAGGRDYVITAAGGLPGETTRSLAAPMCLAQALMVALAARLQRDPAPQIPIVTEPR